MAQIQAYLTFNGNCREAMEFYRDSLGGELDIQTVGDSPVADQNAPASHHRIMHSSLTNDGFVLMASDMLTSGEFREGNAVTLLLNFGSEDEIKNSFERLSRGGVVDSPLREEFWGSVFGMLTDKFGKHWMLNFDKNPPVTSTPPNQF